MFLKSVQSLFIGTFIIASFGCNNWNFLGECKNTSEKEVISPNGKLKIVFFDRGCGATVGFLTGISIVSADKNIQDDDDGNVALTSGPVGKYFRKQDGGKVFEDELHWDAKWINDNKLVIYFPDNELQTEKCANKQQEFENIKIQYLKGPPEE